MDQAVPENSFAANLPHYSVFMIKDLARWKAYIDIALTELNFRDLKDIPGLFESASICWARSDWKFPREPLAISHKTFGFSDCGGCTWSYNSYL